MDAVYAELIRGKAPQDRERIDGELALPLGVTSEVVADEQKAWMAAQGW